MLTLRILVALVLVVVAPTLALSAVRGQTELSFSAGGSFPIGTFEDYATPGFALGASAGYYVSPQFVLGASLEYSDLGASDDFKAQMSDLLYYLTGFVVPVDASWSTLRGSAYGKILFTSNRVAPYAKLSAGYYSLNLSVSIMGESESDSESNLGLGGGLGIQFHGEGVAGGYIEGMAHSTLQDGDDAQFLEIRAGLNLLLGGRN